VLETVQLDDAPSTRANFVVLLLEGILASDGTLGKLLWDLIDDNEPTNWQNVGTSEDGNWVVINDDSPTTWQNISASEDAGWATIEDNKPTDWTLINTA
jgi:hypothetical protein